MNLFELQERLKDFSQDQLVREMQAPTGSAPQYLVLSELQRRQRMMAEEQAQMQTPQTTVAEDAIAAAGVPQGGLADMARAMAPQTDMDMNTAAQPVERMQEGGAIAMRPPRIEDQAEPMSRADYMSGRRERLTQDAIEEALSMMESSPAGAGRRAASRIIQQIAPEGYAAASSASGRGLDDEEGGLGALAILPALFARRRGVDLTKYPSLSASRMADGGVVRMQPGGLAGISRDLDAYSPTMEGGDARPPMMEERDARRRRAAIAEAAESLLRFNRDGTPNVEGFTADLAALGIIPDEELLTEEGLDPRFYPTEGSLEDMEEAQEGYDPVRQGAPLSARPDILMDLVPEPDVTPFTIATGGGSGNRRSGARAAEYTEEDLAGVSSGRGGVEQVVDAPSLIELLSAPSSDGDPRARRSSALAEQRRIAAIPGTFEEEAEADDAVRAEEALQDALATAATFDEEALAADREIAALPGGVAPVVRQGGGDGGGAGGTGGGGAGASAPAGDDAFEQDKWLALAQAGLALMSSQQPTIGGAIGEAGLAGITALRQARGERDERISAQQARADRLAAAASRADREDAYPYRQVDDIVEMAKLFRQSAADIKAANFDQVPAADTPEGIEYRRNLIRANELTRRALAMGGVE